MRKNILKGLFGLFLVSMSTLAFAGNVEDCEFLKGDQYSKGLYGLCIAFNNTDNEQARGRIRDNFAKKAVGDDDPEFIPGDEPDVLTPCPCWDYSDLAAAIYDDSERPKSCGTDPIYGFDFFYVGDIEQPLTMLYQFETGEYSPKYYPGVLFCKFVVPFDVPRYGLSEPYGEWTLAEMEACSDQLRAIDELLAEDCTFSE